MTRPNSSTRPATPKPTRKPHRTPCKLTLAEDSPITTASPPAPIAPDKPARPPRRGYRTPQRCTMGSQYYDERHGERLLSRAVPKLRLTGRWLEQCGFAVGDELQVTVGRGVLLVSRRKGDGR